MTTPLSDERIAAIRERNDTAILGFPEAAAAVETFNTFIDAIRSAYVALIFDVPDLLAEVERLRARVARLEGVLRDVEWVREDLMYEYPERWCPRCQGVEPDHHSDCALDAALRDAHE